MIDKRMFSIFMSDNDKQQSYIEFGGYDPYKAKNQSNIVWLKLEDNFFWTVKVNGYRIGNSSMPDENTKIPTQFTI